jgi:hypothetical protein
LAGVGTGGDDAAGVEVQGHLTTWNLKAANNLKNTSSDTANTAMQQPERLKTTDDTLPPRAEAVEPGLQPNMKEDDEEKKKANVASELYDTTGQPRRRQTLNFNGPGPGGTNMSTATWVTGLRAIQQLVNGR